jgi:hypothetical protein
VACLKKLRIYCEGVVELHVFIVVSLCVYIHFDTFCGGPVGRVLLSCSILVWVYVLKFCLW